MQTQIRRRLMRRLIWVCTVCLCPINGTLGIIGFREKLIKADSVLKHKGAYVAKRQDYKVKYNVWMDRWMDDLRFYVLFNSVSVISGRWADDSETLCAMEPRLRLRRFRLERGSNSGPLDQQASA